MPPAAAARRWPKLLAAAPLALLATLTSATPGKVPAVSPQQGTNQAINQGIDQLLAEPPAELERRLARDPDLAAERLPALAVALGRATEGDSLDRVETYVAEVAAARVRRLAPREDWSRDDLAGLLKLQLLDPGRFAADPGFRERVLALLPRAWVPQAPDTLRDRVLYELNVLDGVDLPAAERIERAWGAVPRISTERQLDPKGLHLRFDADVPALDGAEAPRGEIAASLYSFPSELIDPAAAAALLTAVRRLDPKRILLVLTDLPAHQKLAERTRGLDVHLLETYGRPYSPWPRDPFSLVREPAAGSGPAGDRVVVLVRPNLQPGREEDAWMGAELVKDLPADLDARWGGIRWARANIPFHNGQVLLTADTAWVSLHTLEPRILEILGVDRVPVQSFATAAGIDRYLAAARRAADELATLYSRPVRFVHPLPEQGTPQTRAALMTAIGGGAGYDLDSLLTLLPGRQAPSGTSGGAAPRALVADLQAGADLLRTLPATDWDALRRTYDLAPESTALAAALQAAQAEPRAAALARYLDLVAAHLQEAGLEVGRLPLLRIPVALLRDPTGLSHKEFLLGWNNVVVSTRAGEARAEGFASLLPTADERAQAAFAATGTRLDLLPPLVKSVLLNGGYRCASNHLRGSPPTARRPSPAAQPAGR